MKGLLMSQRGYNSLLLKISLGIGHYIMSNDMHEIQKNAVKNELGFDGTPSTPVGKKLLSTPKTEKKKVVSRPACKTPSVRGKKIREKDPNHDSPLGNSITFASPCNKSRLDYSSVPDLSVDIEAFRAEIVRLQQEHRSLVLAERQLMVNDWNKAKKRAKCQMEFDLRQHENFSVKTQSQLRQSMKKDEKTRKTQELSVKKQEFLALVEAKKELKEEEKRKQREKLNIEREKSLGNRRVNQDKREKLKNERTEKRKAFVESVEAAKTAEVLEGLRVKREKEFEVASDLLGTCKVLQAHCAQQRLALENTQSLIFN